MGQDHKTRLVKPKTKRGARIQTKKEPQLVETSKKTLLAFGNRPSQVVKDVFIDFHKLRPRDTIRLSRKNDDIVPFEAGGEVKLEHFSQKTDCGQFIIGNSTKKRPNNLILGRFFNHRIFDLLELGIEQHIPLQKFGSIVSHVQVDNKPCFIFAGEQFEHDQELKHVKSLLLDLFRGHIVTGIDLLGLDHVIFVTALERKIFLRQYAIKLKKSGTKIPRVELQEMGPCLDLVMRRIRMADPEAEKEAFKTASITKKKEKNVSSGLLEGKIGRIYMPKQQLDTVRQPKMKGSKRPQKDQSTVK